MRVLRCVLALLVTGCAPAPGVARLEPQPDVLLRVAATVMRAAPEVAEVWPGYWPEDQAFALHPFRGAALVVVPAPPIPTGTIPLPDAEVPRELLGKAFLYRAELPHGNLFDLHFRVGERVVPLVGRMDSIFSLRDPHFVTLVYLFHEAFHAHQERHFGVTRGRHRSFAALEDLSAEPRLISAPEFRASAAVERRMLAEALELPAGTELRALLRDYLAVRAARVRLLPPAHRDAEAHNERKEGSAHWVGYAAALTAVGKSRAELPAIVRSDLLLPLPDAGDPAQSYRSFHIYTTGPAIAVLLDRLGVDWKPRMQQGATFVGLLAEAVGYDPDADAARVEEARARFGYPEIVARLPAVREPFPIDQFERQDAHRLVLVGFRPLRVGTSGAPAIPVESGLTVYSAETLFTLSAAPGVSLETESRAVLLDMRAERRLVVMLSGPPTVDGAAPPSAASRVEGAVIEAEGVRLVIDGPAQLAREGRTLIVTLP